MEKTRSHVKLPNAGKRWGLLEYRGGRCETGKGRNLLDPFFATVYVYDTCYLGFDETPYRSNRTESLPATSLGPRLFRLGEEGETPTLAPQRTESDTTFNAVGYTTPRESQYPERRSMQSNPVGW